jgi:arylsulfatase A-like enzyme
MMRMPPLRRAGFGLALLLATGACAPGEPPTPPHVVLVVADTLRADRLGPGGSRPSLTPFLDELAKRGTAFSHAYAPSSWTVPSVASLFTSRYPSQHRVSRFESKMPDSEATLAEALTRAGYTAAGFSANNRLTEKLGYGQGFHLWLTYTGAFVPPYRKAPVRAGFLWNQALRWIDTGWNPERPRPVFLYLQFMDTHTPFDPPPAFRQRAPNPDPGGSLEKSANEKLMALDLDGLDPDEIAVLTALYDGEVTYLDAELRRLFAALEERRFLDNAVVVVTSDHGEEFREHGRVLHGFALYEESVRVPLLMVGPGIREGRVIEQPVSLIDLAPTLLDLAGVPPHASFEGRSLEPLLRGDAGSGSPPSDVLLELVDKGEEADTRGHAWGLVRGSTKLLVDPEGRSEHYDLGRDPAERAPSQGADEVLPEALRQIRADLAIRANPDSERVPLDEAEKQRLRELGYGVD